MHESFVHATKAWFGRSALRVCVPTCPHACMLGTFRSSAYSSCMHICISKFSGVEAAGVHVFVCVCRIFLFMQIDMLFEYLYNRDMPKRLACIYVHVTVYLCTHTHIYIYTYDAYVYVSVYIRRISRHMHMHSERWVCERELLLCTHVHAANTCMPACIVHVAQQHSSVQT